MAKDCSPEGPNESMFKPEGAEKMPTKHYPETTAMGTKGKSTEISGPGENGMFKRKK